MAINLCSKSCSPQSVNVQCAQEFLACLTTFAASCTSLEKTGILQSSVSTADASQCSSNALNLAMWLSKESLAKSTCDVTFQSNEK